MNINLTCPINQRSYGLVGLNLCKELTLAGHTVSLFPIGPLEIERTDHVGIGVVRQLLQNAQLYDKFAPSVRIFHQFSLAQHVGQGRHIGFPIFELNKFNEIEKHHLNAQDCLFVCSEWAKEIIGWDGGVYVVPLGVDTNIFSPSNQPTGKTTKFFNAGKIEIRKNHDGLIKAFNNAFKPSDDVELHMLWNNPFLSQDEVKEWENFYKNSTLGDKIFFHPWMETQTEVASWMNSMDCGVFPSRAEGWNLELLEAMACGKHVIATNYSAHTQFCDDDNCFLIDIDNLEDAYDGKWFFGQGQWAEFGARQLLSLELYMKDIYNLKQYNSLLSNVAGISTAQHFTWQNSAKTLVKALEDIGSN